MSNLVDFARKELEIAGLFDEDSDYGGSLGEAVLKLVEVFSEESHSGCSAAMTSDIFDKLSRFQPLMPLTGEDSEWMEVAEDLWQNKRCFSVFKDNNKAWDIDGIVFMEPDGCCFTSKDSHVTVAFPYVPKTEIVNVPFPTEEL